jgi:hypothetical protein
MSLYDCKKLCQLVCFSVYSDNQNSKQCKLEMRHLFIKISGHNRLLYLKKNHFRDWINFVQHMDIDKRNRLF